MNRSQINPDVFPDIDNAPTLDDVAMDAKAKIISTITAIRNNDNHITPDAPTLPLNFENGTVIADDFVHYLGATGHYSTGAFVKLALGNPLDFQWYNDVEARAELEKFKDRSYFDLGRFLHLAVLEPDKWGQVVVEPAANRGTHDGLDTLVAFWYDQLYKLSHTEENKAIRLSMPTEGPKGSPTADKKAWIDTAKIMCGLSVIEEKQHLIIQHLRNRWVRYADGAWFDILKKAHREVSMYTDEYRGFPMRIRPDGMLFSDQIGVNAIVSVKTTSAANLRQYRSQCAQLGYHIKEAAYQDIASHITGKPFTTTINIVFQTVEPFNVGVFVWDMEDMQIGSALFNDAVAEAKVLKQSGEYPGWDEVANEAGLIDVSLPEWARSTEE